MWNAVIMKSAYKVSGKDRNAQAQPRSSVDIATYIGFRDQRYGPLVTRSNGGDHGASVPFPLT